MANPDKSFYTHHKAQREHWDIDTDEHESSINAKRVKVVDPISLTVADIQIGAVEIKDSITNDRVKVNTDGSINVNQTVASKSYFRAVLNILPGSTSQLFNQILFNAIKIHTIIVGGDADGKFEIKVNSNIIITGRNNIANQQIIFPLNGLGLVTSDVLSIDVTNLKNQIRTFECTIIYE